MDNISYHGTDEDSAQKMIGPPADININMGKGELGKGFYTGSSIALAAIWAQSRFGEKGVVVEFDIPKDRFVKLKGHLIKTLSEVLTHWTLLKANGEHTTHTYGHDYIVAPFSTIEHVGNQYKFESEKAQDELNASQKVVYKCAY